MLIVDDNTTNRKVLSLQTQSWEMTPVAVEDGNTALQLLQNGEKFDLAISDMQMPEMDGMEATRRIIKTIPPGKKPRIVAMTAHAMQGDREKCLAAGMDDYVSKPIKVE